MDMLTPKERILKTLDGQEVDRLPVYDIIHNVELIEYLADDKITSANAEDITCKAVSKVLDLVRHCPRCPLAASLCANPLFFSGSGAALSAVPTCR